MPTSTIDKAPYTNVEYDILQIIADNPEISQRRIAEAAGISLGQANFLMKKFLKKGLIKIEGQSPKSLKYNLTPIGIKEKMYLTLTYVKISYAAVITLTDKIAEIAAEYKNKETKIYVINQQDEMTEIVKIALAKISADYKLISDIAEVNNKENHILLIWGNQSYPEVATVNVLA